MLKRKFNNSIIAGLLFCLPLVLSAQEDTAKREERQSLLYIQYNLVNNKIPYLTVQTKNKTGKTFLPASAIPVSVYLDSDSTADALVGKVITNNKGVASLGLPPTMASKWNESPNHSFIASTEASKDFGATSESITITRAKLEIDTADDRMVSVSLSKQDGDAWVPMPEVDVRIAVKRSGGNLNIGDEESYTTDSTGKIEAEFTRENLPGDAKGKLELVASIQDNDEVGNMESSIAVPWGGTPINLSSNIDHRSLWARSGLPPFWLMFLAYGCILAVWGVIIYLIFQIRQIKLLGK